MCFCVDVSSVIVSVVGSDDRGAQLALSASAPSPNTLTQCRCPPPLPAPQWKTLEQSRASFIAFKWRCRSRAPIQGLDRYHDPQRSEHSSLEQRGRGVNQTLTNDLLPDSSHLQRILSDGWRLMTALSVCL